MLTLNVMTQTVDQTWSIARIANESPPITWGDVFKDAVHELKDVSDILDEQEKMYGQYYPLKKDIFAAFHNTPLNTVKVVIIGQDPYHQVFNMGGVNYPRAVGLSFSVRREDSIPSSLNNIYTELANTVRGFTMPTHGDLREWARQGVLLLNTCLTVRQGQAGSHGEIWLGFIRRVLRAIAIANPYCIFLLWGREAQKIEPMLGERSEILRAAHPSGLSARRGFFGCNHFNAVNDILIKQGKSAINWRISSLNEMATPYISPTLVPVSTTEYQPILTPINIAQLPTIIPIKLPTNEIVVDVPQAKISSRYMIASTVTPLPIIPNTKPGSSTETNKPPGQSQLPQGQNQLSQGLNQGQSQVPTQPTPVPIIPKINFGTTLNIRPPITIGTISPENQPQLVLPKAQGVFPAFNLPTPLPMVRPETSIVEQPQIVLPNMNPITHMGGLPIIPAIIR